MNAEILGIGILSALFVRHFRLVNLLAAPRFVVPAPAGLNALVDLQKIRTESVNRIQSEEIATDQQNSSGKKHHYGFGRKYGEIFQNAFKKHRGSWLTQ